MSGWNTAQSKPLCADVGNQQESEAVWLQVQIRSMPSPVFARFRSSIPCLLKVVEKDKFAVANFGTP